MRKVKKGDIVIYFPEEEDEECLNNGIEGVPAIVTQVFSNEVVNIRVFVDEDITPWRVEVPKINAHPNWPTVEGGGWIFPE